MKRLKKTNNNKNQPLIKIETDNQQYSRDNLWSLMEGFLTEYPFLRTKASITSTTKDKDGIVQASITSFSDKITSKKFYGLFFVKWNATPFDLTENGKRYQAKMMLDFLKQKTNENIN